MGRTYYASSKRNEHGHDRLIHILATPAGTVVLAMRPPEPGERGYAVGVDFTVVSAVAEMFKDWTEEEPGWLQAPHKSPPEITVGDDQTYDVTILAAFEGRQTVDRAEASERVFDILRGWPERGPDDDEIEDVIACANACVDSVLDGTMPPEVKVDAKARQSIPVMPYTDQQRIAAVTALHEIAERDRKTLNRCPEWADVCEVWEGEEAFDQAVDVLGIEQAKLAYYSSLGEEAPRV